MLPPFLPIDFRARDRVLDSTVRADAMWSAAIGIALTKAAAMAWDVESEVVLRSTRAQELLLQADATSISGIGGWVSYMHKQMRNFTCTNGGCYTEIIRATGAYGSRIVGLGHLSALRMRRTGDPEYPFIYIDRWGRQHVMRWWQVFNLVDMPDPDESSLGVGICAAERAYQQIRKLAALEQYLYEKISGSRPLALHIVNGLTRDQLMDMLSSASDSQAAKGMSMYMGAIVATTLKPDAAPSLVTIPLAELPDGFEAASERDRADLIYANALGLDPQDLKPMANQQMGAGAQSAVLHQKAEGRGQAAYRQQLTHMINQLVLDDKTKFIFTERDYQDQQSAAAVATARAGFVTSLVAGGLLNAQQGQQILVEQGEIPKAIVESAAQGGTQLSDTDKAEVAPALNSIPQGAPQPQQQPVMVPQNPAPAPVVAAPQATAQTGAQPPAAAAPLTPPAAPDASSATKPQIVAKKTAPVHMIRKRAIQAGARRILRQIERKGKITEKASAGVWRTIGGHPVLIGGSGGGGGGGAGSGATDTKKPTKTYVPKLGGGGSSIYPTLDAYKKGTITHDQALVQLKQDIKSAKLAGNTKAVNSLTSHYYAMKNGPQAGVGTSAAPTLDHAGIASKHGVSEGQLTAVAALYKSKQDGTITQAQYQYHMNQTAKSYGVEPSTLKAAAKEAHENGVEAKLPPNMPEHSAKLAAHNITEAYVNNSISHAQMEKELAGIGTQSGHTNAELKALAKQHELSLQSAKVVLPTGGTPTGGHLQQAAMLEGTSIHDHAMVVNKGIEAGTANATEVAGFHAALQTQLHQAEEKAKLSKQAIDTAAAAGFAPLASVNTMHAKAQAEVAALQALDKHVSASEGLYGVKKPAVSIAGIHPDDLQAAININAMYEKGTLKLTQYDTAMNNLAKKSGVTKAKLEDHVFNAQAGGAKPGLVGTVPPAQAAANLMSKYNSGDIGINEYMDGVQKLSKEHGIDSQVLKDQAHQLLSKGTMGPTPNASVSQFTHSSGQQYTKIGSVDAAHEWGGQQHFDKPLTAGEKKAFYDYSYQGDEAINKKLRFGQDLNYPDLHGAQLPERRDANIVRLDAVMARSSVPTNIQVHRGFSSPELIARMSAGMPLDGAVFKDQGFVSTAVSSSSAFGQDIKAHINVPKGSKGTYMAQMAKKSFEGETELLLPRNSHFRITGYKLKPKTWAGESDTWEIEMDYLGDTDVPGAFKSFEEVSYAS